jgi:hypothetical protein
MARIRRMVSRTAARIGRRYTRLWADLDTVNPGPVPQRGVYFEVDVGNQAVYITWNELADGRGFGFLTPTSINVQCVLRSNGEFEFRYGGFSIDPTFLGGAIVGWSPGASIGLAATDPGSRDLSATLPFVTNGPDMVALRLTSTLPILATTWTSTFWPLSSLVPTGLLFLGSGSLPGVDLGSIGAPGCRAYSTGFINSLTTFGSSGVGTVAIGVPATTSLLGAQLTTQAAAFTFANPLGLVTSNGMKFVVEH